ncbi:TolC family protein [Mucilaginibacter sp.]
MRKLIIAGVLLFGIAVKSYAQQAPPDTTYNFGVQDCITYAYVHQHNVKNAALDVTSADYRVKEIIGQGLPQVSGAAGFQDYFKIPTTLIPGEFFNEPGTFIPLKFGVTYQSNLTLNVSQIIFDPNYIIGLQGSKTYKQLYERSYARTKIETNVNVTKAYYQVLVNVEQLTLLNADIDQLKQQRDETVARNKQGFVEKVDVDRITVQYNSLVTMRENTKRLLVLDYQLLKFQMGMPIEHAIILKDKLENIQLNANVADTTADSTVYRNRIEYNLLETEKRLNEYDLKSKKAQYLPKLTANGSYSASYQNNSFSDLYSTNYPSGFVGLSLNIPIFSGGQHLNQVRQSKITVLKSQNDLDDMKNTVNLQINSARVSYINGLQTLNDQKKNRDLAMEVLRVSKIKYEQGVGSSIEVTQAQTALQDADNSYIQGLYDALVSKVDLDQAYGRIQ